jgi:hypothetical protein
MPEPFHAPLAWRLASQYEYAFDSQKLCVCGCPFQVAGFAPRKGEGPIRERVLAVRPWPETAMMAYHQRIPLPPLPHHHLLFHLLLIP